MPTITINQYTSNFVGHVDLTFTDDNGNSETFGENVGTNEAGQDPWGAGVYNEDSTLQEAQANNTVTTTQITVTQTGFDNALAEAQAQSNETSSFGQGYNLAGGNCVDWARQELRDAGVGRDLGTFLSNQGLAGTYGGLTAPFANSPTWNNFVGAMQIIGAETQVLKNVLEYFTNAVLDPLVIDFAGTGITITPQTSSDVYFNFTGGNFAQSTSWIGPDDGFLGIAGSNGLIDNGQNLITSFGQLESMDSNGDEIINSGDVDFSKLVVWKDLNGDGICEPGEVFSLQQLGISAIDLNVTSTYEQIGDSAITGTATVQMESGATLTISSVDLNTSNIDTEYTGAFTPTLASVSAPTLKGYGELADLNIATSLSASLLQADQNLEATSPLDPTAFNDGLEQLLYVWAGSSSVAPASGGLFDGQKLAFLEDLLSENPQFGGIRSTPWFAGQENLLQEAWNTEFSSLKADYLAQDGGQEFSTAFVYLPGTDALLPVGTILSSVASLAANVPAEGNDLEYYFDSLLMVDESVASLSAYESQEQIPTEVQAVSTALSAFIPDIFSSSIIAAAAAGSLNFIQGTELGGEFVGTPGADLVDLTQVNASFSGLGGGDEIVINPGLGNVVIDEADNSVDPENVLLLGPGIAPSSVSVTADRAGDLILNLGAGNTVTLANMLTGVQIGSQIAEGHNVVQFGPGTHFGVQSIDFADGTIWSVQDAVTREIADATSGDDILVGSSGADYFDGKGGDDFEQGLGGGDTFVFNAGYGRLEIDEVDSNVSTPDILQLGEGIDPSNLITSTDSSGNIILFDGISGDEIILDGMAGSLPAYGSVGVREVEFADGVVWDASTLTARATAPALVAAHTIAGTSSADVLNAGWGNAEAIGEGGGDTFVFNQGYGQLLVNELDLSASPHNVLQLGPGITPDQVVVTTDAGGDVVLTIGTNGDQVVLDNMLDGSAFGVQAIQFADGTVWTATQAIAMAAIGTTGSDHLYGSPGAELFDGKGGGDFVEGGGGGDTFVFNVGYGQLEIDEVDRSASPDNVLELGLGILPSEVSTSTGSGGDLILTIGNNGDRIILDGQENGAAYGVQEIEFSDGTIWSRGDVNTQAFTQTPGNDHIYGTPGPDLIDGDGGNDFESGGGGGDTFIFNQGYGQLEVSEVDWSVSPDNILKFGAGITSDDLSVTGDAQGDILINDGLRGDQIKLDGELNGPNYGVQSVQFADGTSWTQQQLIAASTIDTSSSLGLYGSLYAELFDSRGVAGFENGGGGNDTFVYDAGYAGLTINEQETNASESSILQFGPGITPSSISVTTDSTGDIIISDGIVGDEITLKQMLYSDIYDGYDGYSYGVQYIDFANGTQLAALQLIAMAETGSPTNTNLYGTWGPDLINSKGYAHYAQGNGGADTFVYNAGYGALEINESSSSAVLSLGAGINAADLTVSGDAAGDLLITDGTAGDLIKLDGMALSGGVSEVEFANGATLTRQQLITASLVASPSNRSLYGSAGAEAFDSQGIATYEQGDGGADTFLYDTGYGALTINEANGAAASTAELDFGPGVTIADITVGTDANGDLILGDGVAGDQITLSSALNGAQFGVQEVKFQDGTSLTRSQLIALAVAGSSSATYAYGTSAAELFNGGGNTRYVQGNGGADTFVYSAGYGQLEINEDSGSESTASSALLEFGAGMTATSLQVTGDSSGDLILTDGVSGDVITLDQMANVTSFSTYDPGTNSWTGPVPEYGVQTVEFADGTELTWQQLLDLSLTGRAGDPDLFGTRGPDLFQGNGFATYEQGGGGGDTFVYNAGDGALEINETEVTGSINVLRLGAGITASQLQAASDQAGDLILTDQISGDSIKLDGMRNSYYNGVDEIQFADGTVWTRQQILALPIFGSPGNTSLYGGTADTVFDGKGYATYEQGNSGADTFIYNQGYGQLEIHEDSGYGRSTAAILQLGPGITLGNLTVTADPEGNIYLSDGQAGDEITIDRMEPTPGSTAEFGVQDVELADGTSLTAQQLIDLATTGSPTNTNLYGSAGGDIFNGKGYATYEQGNGGNDTFVYNPGDGTLEINENAGFGSPSTAVLELGAGISLADITVRGDAQNNSGYGGNLILTDGISGDQITLDRMANTADGGIPGYGVSEVQFADGTVLTRQQLIDMSLQASPTNTQLFGTYNAEVLDSKGYATFEEGNGGADTFIYDRGYGALELEEDINRGDGEAGIIQFGPGITAADLTVTGDASGDLFITDGTAGDQLKLDSWNNEISPGFGGLEFADGTTLDSQQLVNMSLTGSAGNTALYGTFNADTFDSRGIATYEQGNGGADTFIYDAGYGRLRIDEDSGSQPADAVLQLGPGLTASDLHVAMGPGDSLVLTDGVAGDAIALDQMANVPSGQPEYGIGEVQFADGSTLTAQQLLAMNTGAVYGQATASLIDSAGVASLAEGYSGADTFVYNSGYGSLEINENSGWNSNNSILAFGSGISASQLAVYEDNSGDIIVDDGVTGDQITLDGMAYNSSSGVAEVTFADGSSLSANDLFNMAMPYVPPGEVIDGGGADTYEQGGGGPDTFVYNAGYGHLEINEVAQGDSSEAVLQLGPGITPQQLTVLYDLSGNYILLDGTTGDSIQLDGMESSSQNGVAEVQFSDGTTLSASDLFNLSVAEGPAGTVYGSSNADEIDTKGQSSYISDGGGGDTFIYDIGYGQLTINEYQNTSPAPNIIQLGSGITPADVTASVQQDSDWGNDIVLAIGGSSDSITLLGMASSVASGVQAVEFSDGTVWSNIEILSKAEGGVLAVEPWGAPMSFDNASLGGSPVTALNIDDASGNWSVAAGGASFTDLVLTGSQGSSVTLMNALTEDAAPTVSFGADHVSWNYQTLLSDLESPTNSSAGIYGDASANSLDTKGQVSFAHGGGGDDSYVYNAGYGPLTIDNTSTVDAGAHGEIDFGAGETPDNLWLDQNGNDLQIDVLGTNDQIIIQGWYGQNPSAEVATLRSGDGQTLAAAGVEQLVQAMATFEAGYMASNGTAFVPSQSQSAITDPTVMTAVNSVWRH